MKFRLAITVVLLCPAGCSQDTLGQLRGEISVSPNAIDFGDVDVFSSQMEAYQINSQGTRRVIVDATTLENDTSAFFVPDRTFAIPLEQGIGVPVTFAPILPGEYQDVVVITHDADDPTPLRITITGTGVDPCVDGDQDGYGDNCQLGEDCDDTRDDVNPGQAELCNDVDDDCDDQTDEDFPLADDCASTFYCSTQGLSCVLEGEYICSEDGLGVACLLDVPGEPCDGVDNDCNCVVDDPFPDLGLACFVPQGVCQQAGYVSCSAAATDTICDPDFTQPPSCCPPGQELNEDDVCCPVIPGDPCLVSCTIDLAAGTHDCPSPAVVEQFLDTQYGRFDLDLDPDDDSANGTEYIGLEITVEICDASAWTFDLADSPSCNGGGGDGSDTNNDAEIQIQNTTMTVIGNDYSPAGQRTLQSVSDYVTAAGCVTRTLWITDQGVVSEDACFEVNSPYSLRLYPTQDDEGVPDADWYLALNRVVSGTSRSGSGLVQAGLCFR